MSYVCNLRTQKLINFEFSCDDDWPENSPLRVFAMTEGGSKVRF